MSQCGGKREFLETLIIKQKSKEGLHNGRVSWSQAINLCCYKLAKERFHGKVIARNTGLTVGQVYNRCRLLGFSLRDARNGLDEDSRVIIRKYRVSSISESDLNLVKRGFVKVTGIDIKKRTKTCL